MIVSFVVSTYRQFAAEKIIATILLSVFSTIAWADLPLTIEDLLTAKDRYRLEFGLDYANSDRSNVDSRFDLIQTGLGNFVLLPVAIGEERRNADFLVMTLGFRYGITMDTEVFTRLTATNRDVRMQSISGTASDSSQQLTGLVIGLNHKFSDDNDTPALLGFADVSLAENTVIDGTEFVHGKTGQIGFTTYRSIDPVVLSLTAGYRYVGKRDVHNQPIDPGDMLYINPSVGFAVNHEVTLTGAVQLKFTGKDKVAGHSVGIRTSATDLMFGLGYALSKRTTLNFTTRADISGDSGAQLGFNLLYKFGELDLPEEN